MKIEAIINPCDGLYLETKDIKSFSIKQIMVDNDGNMAYAIICYPGPGAGYVVARYNDEAEAKQWFRALLETESKVTTDDFDFYINSKFVQPEKKDPETIGEATLAEETETENE